MYHTEADNWESSHRMYAKSGFEKTRSSQQQRFYNSDYKSRQTSPFERIHSTHYKTSHPDFCKCGMFYFQNNAKNS